MHLHSIRTKVVIALAITLVIGVAGLIMLMRYGFENNSRTLATESVTGSQKLFSILEARETSKMAAVGDSLIANPQIREALVAKDRDRLLRVTASLYAQFKAQGITNVVFHTPEPDMRVLLRVHAPSRFGDSLNRFMLKEAVRTHAIVSGSELARGGFAVRVIQTFPGANGGVGGYLELGEELGQFIHAMKDQTGNDFGLLLSKKYLDRQLWAESSVAWNRRDNWADNETFVVADKTTPANSIIQFNGDLDSLPGQGLVLERFQHGEQVLVRGLFPIRDAAGNIVGAMFVVHDISAFYLSMQHTQNVLIALSVAGLVLIAILVLTLLSRLVFRRLDHIIQVATRVVGGDYATEIKVSSEDEVGQFERLFEQFRRVFVDVLSHVPELQAK
ncbi:MAG TPA: cache domain-containing protein [Terriglobales bacterium]|nr:cache domain-containing protein [Terriglobales bacterium]